MRPDDRLLDIGKFHIIGEDDALRINWDGRATHAGGAMNAATLGDIAFSPTSLQTSTPAALEVTSTVLADGTIEADEIDTYAIELIAGQTYLFSARGSGPDPLIDARLFVYDGTLTATLGHDDDGGDVWNSLLTYTATYTGTHHIGVGTWPGNGLTGS